MSAKCVKVPRFSSSLSSTDAIYKSKCIITKKSFPFFVWKKKKTFSIDLSINKVHLYASHLNFWEENTFKFLTNVKIFEY